METVRIVHLSTAVIYEKPEEMARIEDILPYGTALQILQKQTSWLQVALPQEGSGWIRETDVLELPADRVFCANAWVGFRGAYVFQMPDTERGPFLALPFEAAVEIIEEMPADQARWMKVRLIDGRLGYVQRSQLILARALLTVAEMIAFSKKFLGLNYLWGGTTSFGYDCSGFVQMLYRQMGVTLPRNARQQAVDGRFQDIELTDTRAGDLVFFKNAAEKITHVALMIDANEMIHAFTRREAWICTSPLLDEKWSNGHFYHGLFVKRFSSTHRRADDSDCSLCNTACPTDL
jgi:cell wall-associated NlpC family hydrolase